MRLPRRTGFRFLVLFAVVFLVFLFTYERIFRAAGDYLIESRAPEKADAVLVLAGDWRGDRVRLAGELVKSGYAPLALVSGPMELYGVNEADLAIQFAVRGGASASYFVPVYVRALSTLEEARAFAPELRRRNIRRLLLLTSNYHTHRAASIFRKELGSSVEILPVAAPDKYFRPEDWWLRREGQKTVFYEYSKTLAGWIGL